MGHVRGHRCRCRRTRCYPRWSGLEVVHRSDMGDSARRHSRDAALAAICIVLRLVYERAAALRSKRRSLDLPADSTVLLAKRKEMFAAVWAQRWEESLEGSRMIRRGFGDSPGERVTRLLHQALSRQQASLLTQLRCGHVALNAYLACIRAVDLPPPAKYRRPRRTSFSRAVGSPKPAMATP